MSYLNKFAVIFLAFFAFTAHATTAPKSYTDATKSIMVTQSTPEFTIALASNPTTGYTWHAQHYNANLLKVVTHRFQPSTSTLVGAGGTDIWTFKVKPEAFSAPHVMKINMLYARPWDVNDNNKKLEFTVVTQ